MKILVVGFWGEGNLGDEAILEGISLAAGEDRTLVATAGSKEIHPRVVPCRPRRGAASWIEFLKVLKHCERVVFSGGILQDQSLEGVTFYALRMLAARLARRKTGLWGAGLGPLRSSAAKTVSSRALAGVDAAWLRDSGSADLFLSLTGRSGVTGADWSWVIEIDHTRSKASKRGKVGVNLRPWPDRRFESSLESLLKQVSDKESTLFISARGEDERLMKHLATVTGCKFDLFSPSSFGELCQGVCGLKGAWAMRYHVVVALLRMRIPTIPLCYDDKVSSLSIEAGLNPETSEFTLAADSFNLKMSSRADLMKSAFNSWLE